MVQESMLQQLLGRVRYWAFLAGKLGLAFVGSGAMLAFINLFWLPSTPWFHLNRTQFCYDLGYSTLVMGWFLFSYGLFYLAVWDQKFRCRTCLRRLVMPVETGSWSRMLQLGRPKVEYICKYGHGRLNLEELQFPGKVQPEWTQQGDIWAELYAIHDAGHDADRDSERRR